jgi:hypothetical protein
MKKKFSRLLRVYNSNYLRVCIYENSYTTVTFYDIVISRKIKDNYVRGANLKPTDVQDLIDLLKEVSSFLKSYKKI